MGQRLRLVFAGTPEFAVPSLAACRAADVDVVAVFTQPDRLAGRGRRLVASPVKQAALAANIPVEQPASLKTADAKKRVRAYAPDLLVVVAYGLILPLSVLTIPQLDCWNVHASLLPRWRGAAPIQRAIMAGDSVTGVAIMRMQAGLDTGPILRELREPVLPSDTSGALHDRLAALGAAALGETLSDAVRGALPAAIPQALDGVTYAHKLAKSEARLEWTLDAASLERKVRALNPWPVAEGDVAGELLRIWRTTAIGPEHTTPAALEPAMPGTVIAARSEGIDVTCGQGILRITEVQRAGGRRISAGDWLNARPELRTRR
ncbi:MAG: methionyl-tRNA formyltransferase [Rhodanobacteraceae bacterium]